MIKLVNLRGVTGKARTETYQGRDHLVVPVVALMEGVIWPVNAKAAEFVPGDVLATATQAWNGHPVVMGHPMEDGVPVSANQPRVLEAYGFGSIFNTAPSERVLETKKLELEAWLDLEGASRVGAEAQRVIERAQAGEQIEVSVGAMVALTAQSGTHNGKAYSHVWSKITPDHLAMLRESDRGACSVAMGCGTNRVASAHMHVLTAAGLEPEDVPQEDSMKRTFLQMLRGLAKAETLETAEGSSDVDLRRSLDRAIRALEPGYLYIDEVFPDDKMVVYSTMPGDNYLTLRRGFKVADDGTVSLADDKEEVEPVIEWKPKAAASGDPAPAPSEQRAAGCGCGGNNTNPEPAGGSENMDKNARIAALIANPNSPFKAGDEAMLTNCSDDRLTQFETDAKPTETPAVTAPVVPASTTPAPAPTALASGDPTETPEQAEARWLAGAPQSVRDAVARDQARVTAEKTALVNVLKGCTNGAFTEAELAAKSVPELQQLTKAFNVSTQPQAVDFSLQAPRAAAQGEKGSPPVIDMNEKIRAAQSRS